MNEVLWTGLVMGLMGGFHCAGMCGPIALALPGNPDQKFTYIKGRVFYNLGRLLTYSLMGAVFGIFGLSLNLAGMQQGVSIFSGVLILALQFTPGNLSGKIADKLRLPNFVGAVKMSFARFFQKSGGAAMLYIGLLNGILPCGFVYLALAGSLTTGSIAGGALYMVLFGLGTFPIMLSLSLSGKMLSFKFKFRMQKAVPYIASIIAILFILRGLNLGIPYVSPKMSAGEVHSCH